MAWSSSLALRSLDFRLTHCILRQLRLDQESDPSLDPSTSNCSLPGLSLKLSRRALLVVQYTGWDLRQIECSLRTPALTRLQQRDANAELSKLLLTLASEQGEIRAALVLQINHTYRQLDLTDPYTLFSLYNSMNSYMSSLPIPRPEPASQSSRVVSLAAPKYVVKQVLFWSHHLLASSKRKDILNWSRELALWGIIKPG